MDLSQAIATCKRIAAENGKMLAHLQQQELNERVIQPESIPSSPQPMQQMGPTMVQRLPLPEIEAYSYSPIPSPPKTNSMEHAEDLHNQGLYFDSLVVIEEVLNKDPSNSEALILKMEVLHDMSPADYLVGTELLFIKIKDLIKQRKWDESLKIATLVLEILPKEEQYKSMEAMALTYQATAYRHLGRIDAFRNCITEALAKDPSNKFALKQRFNEFLDFANSILAKDPTNKLALKSKIDALNSVISLLVEQKKTKKALAKIELMQAVNPDPLFVMMKKVYDLKEQNQLTDAEKIGKEALRDCDIILKSCRSPQKSLEYQSIRAICVNIMNQLQDGNTSDANSLITAFSTCA